MRWIALSDFFSASRADAYDFAFMFAHEYAHWVTNLPNDKEKAVDAVACIMFNPTSPYCH